MIILCLGVLIFFHSAFYFAYRTSPSEFIISYDQYMESLKANHSIGTRFKMRFEGEESPEQRYDPEQ